MEVSFTDRTYLITGGGSGIGLGVAAGLASKVDGGHGLRRGPDMSAMLEPVFGPDGLRGVV